MKDVIFTPLAIPPIPNKQKILDRFNAPDFYIWWDEETLLGEKENNNPLGNPQQWTDKAKENCPVSKALSSLKISLDVNLKQ